MKLKSLCVFSRLGLFFLMGVLISGFSILPAVQMDSSVDQQDQLPEGEGKAYVETLCTPCHGLEVTVTQRKSPEGWQASVYDMLGRISAGLDREAEIISKYLAKHLSAETPAPGGETQTPAVTGSQIRVFHQFLFSFKPEVTEKQKKAVLDSGKKMLADIPQVVTSLVGKVAQESSGFQYGLVTGFNSEEDLREYRTHPEQEKWFQDVCLPLVDKSLLTDIVVTK